MTLETILVPCLICNTIHQKSSNTTADKSSKNVEKSENIFSACSKGLNIDVKKIEDPLNWDFKTETLPLCAPCFLITCKLDSLQQQIESLQKEINDIVCELKKSLAKSHQESEATEDGGFIEYDEEEVCLQVKISNYRQLALFGKSSYKLKPRQKHTILSPLRTFEDAENNLYVSTNSSTVDDEVEVKYEPSSPSYFDVVHENDEIDYSTTHDIKCKNNIPEKLSTLINSANLRENLNVETYSDVIVQLMEQCQMLSRMPIIQLNRVYRDKTGKWIGAAETFLQKNKLEESKLFYREFAGIPRTIRTSERNKTYGGIVLKATPDGKQQCGQCDKMYSTATKLVRHIKIVHVGKKEKSSFKLRDTRKILKIIKTEDGKTFYGGIEIIYLENGYKQCSVCTQLCPSCAAVMRHIRWYHLGEETTRQYRQKREAYKIKRMKALGKPVNKESIKMAEDILKRKVDLNFALHKDTVKKKNRVVKLGRVDIKSTVSASNSGSEDGLDVCEDRTYFENKSHDPDFSPEQCEFSEDEDYESEVEKCTISKEERQSKTKSSPRNSSSRPRICIISQTDGRMFCGGIEILVNDKETNWKCGNENCTKAYDNKSAVARHIKSVHLGIRELSRRKKSLTESKAVKRRNGKMYYTGYEVKEAPDGRCICCLCPTKIFKESINLFHHIRDFHRKICDKNKKPVEEGRKDKPHYTPEGVLVGGILSKKCDAGKYQCGFDRLGIKCLQIFPTSYALTSHIKKYHMKGKDAPLHEFKYIKLLTTPDGKKSYGDVKINELGSNRIQCDACKRIWSYKPGNKRYLDGVVCHIRFNHLGKRATELYREKRRAYQIKRMKALGRKVRKKDLIQAEIALQQNKVPITTQIILNLAPDGKPLEDSKSLDENVENTPDKKEKDDTINGGKESEDEDSSEYDFSVDEDGGLDDRDNNGNSNGDGHITKKAEVVKGKLKVKTDKKGRKFLRGVELIETEEEKQQCGKCEKVYSDVVSLTRHIKRVHLGIRSYYTPKMENCDLIRVVEDEDGRKTYAGVDIVDTRSGHIACGACLRCFKLLEQLRRHIRRQHHDMFKTFQETMESTGVATEGGDLDRNKTYFTANGLLYNGVLSQKLENGKYQCGQPRKGQPPCRTVCPSTYSLVNHIRKEHVGELPRPEPLKKFNKTITTEDGRKIFCGVEMVKLDDGSFQCGECHKPFTAKQVSSLMGHITRCHEQKEGGIYVCPTCGRNCGQNSYLQAHMLKHLDERKFVCDECGLSYKQQSSLCHHKRQVHKGIKRHTCELCGKQFYHTRDFIVHQRRHQGEKPYQCFICGKSFYSLNDMKSHEKNHENEEKNKGSKLQDTSKPAISSNDALNVVKRPQPSKRKRTWEHSSIDCNYCEKSFKTSSAAKRHMAEEHSGSDSDHEIGNTSSKSDTYVPNLSNYKTSSAKEQNSSAMPILEDMSSQASNNMISNPMSSLNHSSQQHEPISMPPPLMQMYDFISPSFPMYGRPPF